MEVMLSEFQPQNEGAQCAAYPLPEKHGEKGKTDLYQSMVDWIR